MNAETLQGLISKANARYDAMSPEQQADMWRKQRDSFVRAMTTPCEHGELDWETCVGCREKTP